MPHVNTEQMTALTRCSQVRFEVCAGSLRFPARSWRGNLVEAGNLLFVREHDGEAPGDCVNGKPPSITGGVLAQSLRINIDRV